MVKVNENYLKLQSRYLFSEIAKRTKEYVSENPNAPIIRLGIGDTTQPLPNAVVDAFVKGVEELRVKDTYRGYGPEQGYEFLKNAIVENDYKTRGVKLSPDEIFISDGSKCDTGNILEIFGKNIIAISDPAYPVYVDTNVMDGNTGPANEHGEYEGIVYLRSTEETGFKPPLPDKHVDIIYLCSPNNPTGTALNRDDLKKWVEYARKEKAIILFDAAYDAYITEDNVPRSIYEIEGADECAIEFKSYSKSSGFTGVRCAFTVIPKKLKGYTESGKSRFAFVMEQRHTTKFNVYHIRFSCRRFGLHRGRQKTAKRSNPNITKKTQKLSLEGLKAINFKFWRH